MDAEAFDRAMSRKQEKREREMDVYQGILAGYQEARDGKTPDASDAFARIRAAKGWNA